MANLKNKPPVFACGYDVDGNATSFSMWAGPTTNLQEMLDSVPHLALQPGSPNPSTAVILEFHRGTSRIVYKWIIGHGWKQYQEPIKCDFCPKPAIKFTTHTGCYSCAGSDCGDGPCLSLYCKDHAAFFKLDDSARDIPDDADEEYLEHLSDILMAEVSAEHRAASKERRKELKS